MNFIEPSISVAELEGAEALARQAVYCANLMALVVVAGVGALCAGCENSDRANKPVSKAIKRFLVFFISKA